MIPVAFTAHAVERYVQRVRPDIDLDTARAGLDVLAETAVVIDRTPPWGLHDGHDSEHAATFLVLGDVAFPLQRCGRQLVATTCVVRREGQDEAALPKDHRHISKRKLAAEKRDGRRARRRARVEAEERAA